MPPRLRVFLQRWVITTVAVLIAELIVKGIGYDNWRGLLIATLLLGLMNAFLRPLLIFVTIGALGLLNFILGVRIAMATLLLQILFLGFLLLAINAVLLLLVGRLVRTFHVNGFWPAFWGGLVIGIVTLGLNSLTKTGNARVEFHRGPGRPPSRRPDDDDGPVIDI
jgi:putative membrane protein